MMRLKRIIVAFLIFIFITAIFPVSISAASSSLTTKATVRSGDTIAVKFTINDLNNASGIEATIKYTGSILTYTGYYLNLEKSNPAWQVGVNKLDGVSSLRILAYDDSGEAKLSGTQTICTLYFKVKGSTGKEFALRTADVLYSVLNKNWIAEDVSVAPMRYTDTISAPLSKNAYLSSLKVTNAKISPSFSKTKTKYSTTVSHSTTKLKISAKAAVSGAKIKITNNSLKAGRTTYVKITVTAPAGNTKTYTIAVKRR